MTLGLTLQRDGRMPVQRNSVKSNSTKSDIVSDYVDSVQKNRADLDDQDEEKTARVLEQSVSILNSNALIAALFLTFEVPLLSADVSNLSDDRASAMLYLTVTAVISHVVCIFIAAEATFVLASLKQIGHPMKQAQQLKTLASEKWWGRSEPISGITFLLGLCCAIAANGVTLSAKFGNPRGDAMMVLLVAVAIMLFYVAFGPIGGYVTKRHKEAAQISAPLTKVIDESYETDKNNNEYGFGSR